jgi:hypothetical protein
MRTLVIAVLAILLALAVAAPAAGGGLVKPEEQKRGVPTETEAVVYFIRKTSLGAAIKFWAFADQEFIGVTRGKSYTFGLVPEGKHLFWSKAENIATHEMEVVGGQTYYLLQEVRMGGLRARVRLSLMSAADGEEALKACKYVVPTAEGHEKGREIAREQWARAQEKEGEKDKWEATEESE